MFETFPDILTSFFIDPPASGWMLALRIIFIVLVFALAAFIVFALWKTSWLKFRFLYDFVEFFTYRPFGAKKREKDWQKIMARLNSGLESEHKLAVIEADNMFDEVLKEMRYEGETFGERLEKVKIPTLFNVEEVKEAHQIRNNIVHDPNYSLSLNEARRALENFERAFKSLDVL